MFVAKQSTVAYDDDVLENSFDEKRSSAMSFGDAWRSAAIFSQQNASVSSLDNDSFSGGGCSNDSVENLHKTKPRPNESKRAVVIGCNGQPLRRPSLPSYHRDARPQQPTARNRANLCSPLQNCLSRPALKVFRVAPPSNIGNLRFRDGLVPLPKIGWAESDMVWNLMCWKDTIYCRNPHVLQRHPALQPKMRAILIDWLCEVSEVYKLHRETFYLAIDFVDRYLSKEKNVEKDCLQLIGVTALFVAAKIEEIYPPKCADFAYITDGACTPEQISGMELCILKSLNWALAPITAVHWMTIYLQLIDQQENRSLFDAHRGKARDLAVANYHRYHFIHLAQLIDLCVMDVGSLQFPYSVLAACAFAHILQPDYLALHVSGFKHDHIAMCYAWMQPFARAVLEKGEIQIKHFYDVSNDDLHNIQTHVVDMDSLERAQSIRAEMEKASRMSPVFSHDSFNTLPTPPPSDERPGVFASRRPPFCLRP